MRTWILLAAFIIADAIHPEYKFDLTLSWAAISLGIAGMLMDTVDFFNKHWAK